MHRRRDDRRADYDIDDHVTRIIRHLLVRDSLTMEQAAARIGMSRQLFYDRMNPDKTVTFRLAELCRLAELFKVRLAVLVDPVEPVPLLFPTTNMVYYPSSASGTVSDLASAGGWPG